MDSIGASIRLDFKLRHYPDLQQTIFATYWREIFTGRAGLFERLSPLLAKLAPDINAHTIIEYWFDNDARLNGALLKELARFRDSGLRVFLATNQEHLRANYLLKTLGLSSRVDGIFYSAALGCKKPDAAFFEKAQSQSGFAAHELLLLDDSAENVAAAKRAGWNALLWTGHHSLSDMVLAAPELASFVDLPARYAMKANG